MYEPLSVMKTRVGDNVGIVGNSDYDTKIGRWLDDAYEDAWRFFLWPQFLQRDSQQIAAAANTLVLPYHAGEILALYNVRTPMWSDFEQSALFVRRFISGLEDTAHTGIPTWHADDGEHPVTAQPTSATALKAVSSSASDITQKVRIWGHDSNGVEVNEQLTLNGTTEATSTQTFAKVIKCQKDATTAGIVSIKNGTTVIARIAAHEYTSRYKRYLFNKYADVATTWYWITKRRPIRFVNADDTPEFDCSEALVAGATARAFREQGQNSKAEDWANGMTANLISMKKQILGQGDRVLKMTPQFSRQFTVGRRWRSRW